MKAAVYTGPGRPSWNDVPAPSVIDPTDAVVRVDAVTICGTDLHILKGDVPTVDHGRMLGHEAVGTIEAGRLLGHQAPRRRPGPDLVHHRRAAAAATAATVSTGSVWAAEAGSSATASTAPRRSTSGSPSPTPPLPDPRRGQRRADAHARRHPPHRLRGRGPERAGSARGRRRHRRRRPGRSRPIMGARLSQPAAHHRRRPGRVPAAGRQGLGADITIDRVRCRGRCSWSRTSPTGSGPTSRSRPSGSRETFELCAAVVRPGGRVANVGVHGAPATLHLEDLWIRNVTITTGLVDTYSMPTLIRLVQGGRLDLAPLITHRFALDDLPQAYDVFADAGRSGALKVVLTRS